MSAPAHGLRGKIFGLMKNWFGQPAEPKPPTPVARSAAPSRASASGTARSAGLGQHAPKSVSSAYALELPLRTILSQFPTELQQRVVQGASDVSVAVPLQTVLPQLTHGSVKISFGELRSMAPGVFAPTGDRDHMLVQLPLAEILPRISPNLLRRRQTQKRTEVPADVSGPFSEKGQGVIFSVGPAKAESSAPKPLTRPASPPLAPRPPLPRGGSLAPVPSAPPPSHPQHPAITPPPPLKPPVRPVAPPVAPALASRSLPRAPVPAPAVPPSVRSTKPPIRVKVPSPRVAAPLASSVNSNGSVLMVPLANLQEGWPDAIKQEIAVANLAKALVALPMDFVETGLKHGRVSCAWKQLHSWLKPEHMAQAVSAHDGAVLELPLRVLAPLFLSKQQTTKAQRKVDFDMGIPDLFFDRASSAAADVSAQVPLTPVGAPLPASPPVKPQPKPPETDYYVWRDDADRPFEPEPVFKRGPSSPGTDFLKRYATPNEIVSRAAALDGVAGALISLPDGLLVASRIPPELNADTLAAFLPQIFGRVSQCTKELRMGELNNVNFTVGNVPWRIFKVGAIFFAAFGRTGDPLPTAQLAGLAAELDRKPRH